MDELEELRIAKERAYAAFKAAGDDLVTARAAFAVFLSILNRYSDLADERIITSFFPEITVDDYGRRRSLYDE